MNKSNRPIARLLLLLLVAATASACCFDGHWHHCGYHYAVRVCR